MITSRHTWLGLIGLSFLITVAAVAPDTADAGVVVISRSSTLNVEGQGIGVPFEDSASFTGSGAFSDTVSGEEGNPPDGTFARGTAAQDTTVTFASPAGTITGSGSLSAEGFAQLGDQPQAVTLVEADSILEIVFQVLDDNEPFNITGTFDNLSLFPAAEVLLIDDVAGGGTAPVFQALNDANVLTEPTFDSGTHSLSPSTYRLTISTGAGSSGTGPGGVEPFGESHGLSFNLSVGDAGEPPPPGGVIPLPAGVWAGMLGLAAAGGAVKSRRRS